MGERKRGWVLGVAGGAVLLTLLLLAMLRSDPDAGSETAEPGGAGLLASASRSPDANATAETSLALEAIRGEASERARVDQDTAEASERARADQEASGATEGDAPDELRDGATPQRRSGEMLETAATRGVDASFGPESLIEAGVEPSDADWVWDRYEANERERAELESLMDDRRLTPEERRTLHELDGELMQEIGADNYDRLLYAAGMNNRVSVGRVRPGRPGAAAGLMPGDLLVSYAGEPVYRTEDLRWRATQRAASAPTNTIVYQRGGQFFEAEMRTGWLGLGLRGYREQP